MVELSHAINIMNDKYLQFRYIKFCKEHPLVNSGKLQPLDDKRKLKH